MVYDNVVGLIGVSQWAASRGLNVVAVYGDNSHLLFFRRAAGVVDGGLRLIAAASLGRLTARWSNLALVLVKP